MPLSRRSFTQLPVLLAAPATLDQQVRSAARGFAGTVSLYAKNLVNGAEYALQADNKVRTASTIKLSLMVAVFRAVSEGRAKWDETLLLRDTDKVSGSGVLHEFSDGIRLPLRDVMHLMIVVSDNTATNLLVDRFGADAANEEMDRYGLKNTRLMRKVRGDGNQLKSPSGWSKAGLIEENKRFGLGSSTSREMVALLEKIHRGEAVSQAASKEMIEVLKRQQYKDGIGRRMKGWEVASKSGALDALRSDVGIVYHPKAPVAIAITVDGMPEVNYTADNKGAALIATIAPLLVNGLTRG